MVRTAEKISFVYIRWDLAMALAGERGREKWNEEEEKGEEKLKLRI